MSSSEPLLWAAFPELESSPAEVELRQPLVSLLHYPLHGQVSWSSYQDLVMVVAVWPLEVQSLQQVVPEWWLELPLALARPVKLLRISDSDS